MPYAHGYDDGGGGDVGGGGDGMVVMVAAVVAVVVLMVVVWGNQRGRRQPQTRALQVGHPCSWAIPEVAGSGVVCP